MPPLVEVEIQKLDSGRMHDGKKTMEHRLFSNQVRSSCSNRTNKAGAVGYERERVQMLVVNFECLRRPGTRHHSVCADPILKARSSSGQKEKGEKRKAVVALAVEWK